MAQKTYKQIEAEANRMFGNKPSKEKFEWRRAQQREAGLDTEGKKRGGVAGAYDRNKKLVSAAATAAGYMLGGPAGAAASRGFIQGVDRPGKSGIGFDVGRAAKGAMEGYGAANLANLGKAGMGKLLGGGSGIPSLPAQAPMVDTPVPSSIAKMGANVPPVTAPVPAPTPQPGMMSRMLGGAGDMTRGAGNILSGAAKFGRENASWLGPAATAAAGVLGQRSEQALEEQRMAQQQQQFQKTFDVGEEERRRQREQANRLAGLFMPRSA